MPIIPLLKSKNNLIIAFFSMLLFGSSCVRMPNIQGKGEVFMQGVWNEDSVAYAKDLKSYTQHHFKFTCDSFYVNLTTHSKINLYEPSCYNNGVWKEYAKGIYAVRNDTLVLGGTFTHENYKQKISGCYRNGRYETKFVIKKSSENNLLLESLSDQRETNLVLKEKITCVQKEL